MSDPGLGRAVPVPPLRPAAGRRPRPGPSSSAQPSRRPGRAAAWTGTPCLDDGRRLIVDRSRAARAATRGLQPGEEDAQLIKIADETRTVSKLHLAIGVDEAGLYVVDRGSTNGSTVTNPGGATRRCAPGDVVYVSEGSIVSMGDHWLEIRRSP